MSNPSLDLSVVFRPFILITHFFHKMYIHFLHKPDISQHSLTKTSDLSVHSQSQCRLLSVYPAHKTEMEQSL